MKIVRRKLNRCCLLMLTTLLFMSCSDFATDERKSAQLILKKDGKTYLFSHLGTFITKNKLEKNESPSIAGSIRVVEKNDQLFIEPQQLEPIANLISGNYVLHDYPNKIIDGYVTEGTHEIYDKKYVDEPTDKIGKMNRIAHINLKDIVQKNEYQISWQRGPNQHPIKNCVEMALWVDKSYKPGERTATKENFIMISLNDLVTFYQSNVKIDYQKEEEVLYIFVD